MNLHTISYNKHISWWEGTRVRHRSFWHSLCLYWAEKRLLKDNTKGNPFTLHYCTLQYTTPVSCDCTKKVYLKYNLYNPTEVFQKSQQASGPVCKVQKINRNSCVKHRSNRYKTELEKKLKGMCMCFFSIFQNVFSYFVYQHLHSYGAYQAI